MCGALRLTTPRRAFLGLASRNEFTCRHPTLVQPETQRRRSTGGQCWRCAAESSLTSRTSRPVKFLTPAPNASSYCTVLITLGGSSEPTQTPDNASGRTPGEPTPRSACVSLPRAVVVASRRSSSTRSISTMASHSRHVTLPATHADTESHTALAQRIQNVHGASRSMTPRGLPAGHLRDGGRTPACYDVRQDLRGQLPQLRLFDDDENDKEVIR